MKPAGGRGYGRLNPPATTMPSAGSTPIRCESVQIQHLSNRRHRLNQHPPCLRVKEMIVIVAIAIVIVVVAVIAIVVVVMVGEFAAFAVVIVI